MAASTSGETALADLVDTVDAILWEGDAKTFQFTFVSQAAERILGYPVARWYEPNFWADVIVHPEDRDDAVAYCALATGQGRDHTFEYRARAADGRLVWLRDIVRVVPGAKGVPESLRGVMVDVTEGLGVGVPPEDAPAGVLRL